MPGRKAASLIGMTVCRSDPYAALEAALRTHVIGSLGGDPYRDIDEIDVAADPTGCLYWGKWRGHLRLTAGVAVDSAGIADVLLIATKGALCADETLFGKTGPDVGNSVLIARLVHVALFALRSAGAIALRNDPYDVRVQRHYEDMGFQGGAYLPLDDLVALTKTFAFVEQTYQHPSAAGLLSVATPPLPL